MPKYHFSARFKGGTLNYHGEFDTVLKDTSDIVKKAKIEFKKKCETWNKNPALIVKFEIYYFTGDGEKKVFEYSL